MALFNARRLGDLLVDPHETLEVELKDWLDIVGNNDHKANARGRIGTDAG
jgi:hypothetical protein